MSARLTVKLTLQNLTVAQESEMPVIWHSTVQSWEKWLAYSYTRKSKADTGYMARFMTS